MTKLKACSSTPNFSFKLTQVSACMVSAALLTIVPMQYALAQELSSAQIAKSNLTGNIDGSLRAGFIVTDDSNFDGSAAITVGNTSSQSLVHNFNTVGGSGSGGGAGLGGAFFVDTGATLTIINTDFKSNRVQGGAGGSAPALLFYDKNLIVTGSSVDLPSYFVNAEVAGGATPLLQYNNGKYSFNYLSVSRDIATLIKKDSVAIFDDYDVTTKISNIGSDVVSFAKPIEASATNVPKFVENVSSGFMSTANGAVIVNYKLTPDTGENEGKNKTVEIPDLSSVTVGQKVVASTNGRTSLQVATVVSVEYFTKEDDDTKNANGTLQGKVKSINLDKTISGSVEYIDVIKAPTFKATQFATDASGKVVTVTSTLGSFTSGMTVSWVEGSETKTAKVLSVGGPNNRTLTLDSAIASNVTDIKAVENPLTGDNTINIPNAATKFSIGQSIYVPGKEGVAFEGTVLSISGSEVTVTPKLQNAKLADHYDPALGLALKTSAASVSQVDRTLVTVSYNTNGKSEASIKAQLVGHLIDGASFPDDTVIQDVRVSNGSVTLVLSKPVNDGSVDFFKVYSPLKMGGSMNNVAVPLVASIQPRSDGTDGNSANSVSTFFNDGEGVDGTNGAAAGDNKGGQGFNGGDGGSGSNGANVNPWLIYDVAAAAASMKSAATDLSAATADMVEASAPDPVVGAAVELPDPLKIATATINLTKANIDMGFAVADTILAAANMGYWADQLREGLAGLGGAGGDGGEASDGGKFFGGGAGGAGGAGGDGAYEISDGGSGGGGGQGGAGGFGAGGGAGGAGGTKGENGNAVDGDPGDGGFAGFGAGDGTDGKGRFGGGGDGLGGSIFVRSGGGLLINGNALFERNYVAGGSTTSQFGEAGGAAGTDMFIMKGSNIRLAPGLGKVIQFDGTIADDSLATDGGFQNAAGDGADIRIGGQGNGGLVIFNGENTYSGNTILEGATLTALVGVGVNDASLIRFNGAGVIAPDLIGNKVVSSMSLDTVGTFLLQEDYVRRAGLDPSETAWTGSGGFASSLADGVTVNLGALDDNGRGQDLTWGQDGFFAPFDNGSGYSGALTFGSDLSQGAVRFTNNVDLNNKTASIAVYNNGNLNTSTATLSGNWGNSTGNKGILVVGDSGAGSPYNGNLFMTGQNSLDSLVVAGGVLSTYNADGSAGRLMKPTGDLFVLADKDVEGAESHLDLFSDESVRNVHVMKGGVLTLTQTLVASDVVQNEGLIAILGENVTSLPDAASVALKPIYLPLNNGGFTAWEGGLVVKKTMINSGVVTQAANAELGNLINLGIWNGFGNVATTEGSLDNSKNAKFMVVGNVNTAGNLNNAGLFDLTGKLTVGDAIHNDSTGSIKVVGESSVAVDLNNSGSINLTGDLGVGRNLINRENAVFSIAGNTTVENAVYNYGAIEQKGNMNVEASVQNNGYWRFGQDATINALSLLGSGVFCLSDTTAANCSGGNAKKLSLSLSASTTFNGVFTGNGGFEKLGASKLQLTEAQQFTGDLLINGGTLEMAARATLNDSVHVVVGSEGSFIVGVEDTIRKVTNNGKNSVVLNADLTVTNGFVNNGRLIADAGLNNNRVLQLQESGLTGSSDGQLQITEGTTFVLAQNGNTSYEGQIQSLGNRDTSSLLKSGTGTLTLNNSVDVKNILIGQGELALNKEGILKQDAIVTIGGNGKLSLVTGDQSIDKLLGEGVVNIGSNDLMIANGGAFKGEILGSGQVAVDKGTFKVSGAIVSSNADFAVRDGSTTVLGKNGVLSVDRLNVQSGGVLALGEDTSDQGGRVTTNTFDVHGVLKGSGFIEGAATIHSGGQLKPGYSPGRLYFGNDLNLATGSNVEMEIQNPTENPGTGFDQVVIGGSFNIQGGAKLKVAGLGNSSPNLSMGQSVNIFSFQPGQGYGVFGEVTAENMGNSIALNLATGNVVGFGSKVLGDVASTAKSSNEQSIYTGLLQKNTGGVAQFYGGHFIERLTAAFDNEQNTKSVYNSYNPESYLALSDIAQAAAQDALPVWKFQHANQDRLFAYATNTTRANGQHADHQSVGLGIRAYTVGASQKIGENTLLATFGGVKSNVQSKYVNSTGNGVTVGLSLQGAVNTLPESIWFAGLSHANLDSKGTRLGTYRFQDVNSSATQVQAGLESKFSFEHLYLMTRGAFALGSSNRGRVDESSSSPLNTMSVYAARHHYKLLDLALEVGQQINTQTSWYGSANFQVGDLNNNRIIAGFDNDQAQFTVTGKSAMGSNTRLMAGVRHQYSPAMSVDFSLGWARGWDRSTDIQARFGLSKSF